MRSVRDIPKLDGIPVLVRAALNVPVAGGKVVNDFRLRQALPTIEFLRSRHARVILLGHIGDQGTETLAPVHEALQRLIGTIAFCPVTTGSAARAAARETPPGGVLMLENTRRNAGEVKNDTAFAQALSELADVFVMDAFDACHRPHASVVGVPDFLPSYAGLQVEREVTELSRALTPKRPSLAILGGAKFSTKEPVLTRLLERYDRVFVGGALANDFMVARGLSVGTSLVSKNPDQLALGTLLKHPRLMLPLDEVVADKDGGPETRQVVTVGGVPRGKAVRDDGPETVAALAALAMKAKTVLWNGPLGLYEKGFSEATHALARALAASSAYTVLGGGDTVAAVEELGITDQFSFISTGGGAMLDFIAKGTLPGLAAIGYRPAAR
jgi:phosphoglycerate kinase